MPNFLLPYESAEDSKQLDGVWLTDTDIAVGVVVSALVLTTLRVLWNAYMYTAVTPKDVTDGFKDVELGAIANTSVTTVHDQKRPTTLFTPADEEADSAGYPAFSKAHVFLRKYMLKIAYEDYQPHANNATTHASPQVIIDGKIADATCRACIACKGCGQIIHRPPSLGGQDYYIGIMKLYRIHIRDCPEVPEAHKVEYNRLKKEFKKRGKKSAWPNAARTIGLVEMVDENGDPAGLTYLPPTCTTDDK